MVASPRVSPAARVGQDGGGAPPSPPSTPSPGGRGTRGVGGPHGFASEEEARAEERASRSRHPTALPFGLWEGDLGRARRRVAALAPWASSRSARSGPTLGLRSGDGDGPGPDEVEEGTRALPLWLCIGVPLAIVLMAFVAIAVFTAPTGTDSLPSGPRVVTDGGGGERPLPTAEPVTTTEAPPSTTTTTAEATTSTTEEPEATTTTAPEAAAPPSTSGAATPGGPPAGPDGGVTLEPEVGVLPLVEAVTGRGCHPSYAPCVPRAEDVDCAGEGDGPEHVRHVRVIGPDEYGLDPDGNGVGCD
jgi:hypothetical protein